jgi:GNAT superfamily N-acetyltransferase
VSNILSAPLRLLDPKAADSFAALRAVVLAAPRYAQSHGGCATAEADVRELIGSLPPGCKPAQKELWLVQAEGMPIGCISLVRGWPAADTAHIGLLLIAENQQGQGHGSAALAALEERLLRPPAMQRMRIAVLSDQPRVQCFWRRQGFAETGQVQPSWAPGAELRFMAKRLLPRHSLSELG